MINLVLNKISNFYKNRHTRRQDKNHIILNINMSRYSDENNIIKNSIYDQLTQLNADIRFTKQFDFPCLELDVNNCHNTSEIITLIKNFLIKLHPTWICNAIVISIQADFLLTANANTLTPLANTLNNDVFNIINRDISCYIYCSDLYINQETSPENIHKMLSIIRSQSLYLNHNIEATLQSWVQIVSNNNSPISPQKLLQLVSAVSRAWQSSLTLSRLLNNKQIHIEKLIFDNSLSLKDEFIQLKCYRFKICRYISIPSKQTYLIIVLLFLILLLIISYNYNKNLIKNITVLSNNRSIQSKLNQKSLNEYFFTSLPFLNVVNKRYKIFNHATDILKSLANNEIESSLSHISGYTNSVLVKQRKQELALTRQHTVFNIPNQTSGMLILPSFFYNHSLLPKSINLSLLTAQAAYLKSNILQRYLKSHIHTPSQAIIYLNQSHIITLNYNPDNLSKLTNIYMLLNRKYRRSHSQLTKQKINYTLKIVRLKISSLLNNEWHRHLSKKIIQDISILKSANIATNLNLWLKRKTVINSAWIEPRFLSAVDSQVNLKIGNQSILYSHGPLTPTKLTINTLQAHHCTINFKSFTGASYASHLNHQACFAALLGQSAHHSDHQNEIIDLTSHHQIFGISIPEKTYKQLTSNIHHLPRHIILKGDIHAT